jgi:sarcosine oxidase gamma subunit
MSRSPLEPRLTKFPLVVAGREQALLRLDDLSERPRFGCKGPGAEAWLAGAGYRVPSGANSALVDERGVLVARLATSEFLIEALEGGGGSQQVDLSRHHLATAVRPRNVYPVAREDLVIGIQGAGLPVLLRQICSVDFVPWFESAALDAGAVVLTSMIGVSVVAWPRPLEGGARTLTLWSDPSFAHYFWTTLLEVGRGVGAMVIGSNT